MGRYRWRFRRATVEYICPRKLFDISLKIEGTEFQRRIWNTLLEIPYGETRTYLDIVKQWEILKLVIYDGKIDVKKS